MGNAPDLDRKITPAAGLPGMSQSFFTCVPARQASRGRSTDTIAGNKNLIHLHDKHAGVYYIVGNNKDLRLAAHCSRLLRHLHNHSVGDQRCIFNYNAFSNGNSGRHLNQRPFGFADRHTSKMCDRIFIDDKDMRLTFDEYQ